MKHFLPLLLCVAACCARTGGHEVGPPSERAKAAVSNFCRTFRPDLLTNGFRPERRTAGPSSALEGVSVWGLPAGTGREARFHVDLEKNEVVFFSVFKGFSAKRKTAASLSEQHLDELRRQFLERAGLDTKLLKRVRAQRLRLSPQTGRDLAEAVWQRCQNGFEFKHDFVRLVHDPADGELVAYRRVWGEAPESWSVRLKPEQAKVIAERRLVTGSKGAPALHTRVVGPAVVCPNPLFGAARTRPDVRKLAWVVEVPRQQKVKHALEIWVDAADGTILGGETFLWIW